MNEDKKLKNEELQENYIDTEVLLYIGQVIIKPIFAFFAKIHEFLKQKFIILFQFLCKIFNSRILTNILLIIVILKLTYIGHRL